MSLNKSNPINDCLHAFLKGALFWFNMHTKITSVFFGTGIYYISYKPWKNKVSVNKIICGHMPQHQEKAYRYICHNKGFSCIRNCHDIKRSQMLSSSWQIKMTNLKSRWQICKLVRGTSALINSMGARECCSHTKSIPFLMMTWLPTPPCHQQSWCWLCDVDRLLKFKGTFPPRVASQSRGIIQIEKTYLSLS